MTAVLKRWLPNNAPGAFVGEPFARKMGKHKNCAVLSGCLFFVNIFII